MISHHHQMIPLITPHHHAKKKHAKYRTLPRNDIT